MAFDPIDSDEIAEGKPVHNTTQQKIKTNFDDHENRLYSLEGRENLLPIILRVNGPYSFYGGSQSTVIQSLVTRKLVIVGARLIVDQAGTGGITEINIRRVRAGDSHSIFDVFPSLSYTAGDDAVSTNGVLNLNYRKIDNLDLLELDIESVQTSGVGFMVRLDVVRDES